MKQLLSALLLMLSTIGCSAQVAVENVHPSTHKLWIKTTEGRASCSITAIGHHALLTAGHCIDKPLAELYMVDDRSPLVVKRVIRDGADHAILLVDQYFEDYVNFSPGEIKPFNQPVFWFGNPGPLQDVLRKGYTAGNCNDDTLGKCVYLEAPIYFGDSGSAVFDDRGRIVGVISQRDGGGGFYLAISFLFHFTSADILAAQAY